MCNKNNFCAFCGNDTTGYELCSLCYRQSKEGNIIKTENGNWIKKDDKYKFYDKTKKYYLKTDILNEWELKFYHILNKTLENQFAIIPQINLQSIIVTNSYNRNDELFRNIDFGIFTKEDFKPILMIELNGKQHFTNGYYKERDISINKILEEVKIPILNITIKDLKTLNNNNIIEIIKRIMNYIKTNKYEEIDMRALEEKIKKLGAQT